MQPLKKVGAGLSPISELVSSRLLEDKAGQSAVIDSYALKWTFDNELALVVVIVYQKMLQCPYAEELLDAVKSQFIKLYQVDLAKQLQGGKGCINCAKLPIKFDKYFDKCLLRVDHRGRQFQENSRLIDPENKEGDRIRTSTVGDESDEDNHYSEESETREDNSIVHDNDGNEIISARAKLMMRAGRRGKGMRPTAKALRGGTTEGRNEIQREITEGKKKAPKKERTIWRDGSNMKKKISESEVAALDFSKRPQNRLSFESDKILSEDDLRLREYQDKYLPDQGEVAEWDTDGNSEDSDYEGLDDTAEYGREDLSAGRSGNTARGWFGKSNIGSFLQTITGNKVLESSDLEPVLDQMRNQLIRKNVAAEIADNICASVSESLAGQKLASFSRVETKVVAALKAAVLRVLTPRKSTDILHEIRQNRVSGHPYVIVFVGINGVGKSTSLAKVCYYLKQNGVKVSIAACDTFRSGAVEQLRSHARCLDVPLFERGYLKVCNSRSVNINIGSLKNGVSSLSNTSPLISRTLAK